LLSCKSEASKNDKIRFFIDLLEAFASKLDKLEHIIEKAFKKSHIELSKEILKLDIKSYKLNKFIDLNQN
jgi:hypothetical protein